MVVSAVAVLAGVFGSSSCGVFGGHYRRRKFGNGIGNGGISGRVYSLASVAAAEYSAAVLTEIDSRGFGGGSGGDSSAVSTAAILAAEHSSVGSGCGVF